MGTHTDVAMKLVRTMLAATALFTAAGCLGSSVLQDADTSAVTATYTDSQNAQTPNITVQTTANVTTREAMRFTVASNTNNCVFVPNNAPGAALQARPCNSGTGMHWAFQGGQLVNDNGLCLGGTNPADANFSTAPVAQVCDPYADDQQWTLQRDTLRLTNTTRCLTWPDGVSGDYANLTLTTCDDTNAPVQQRWPVSTVGFDLRDPLNPNNCLQVVGTPQAGAQVFMGPCASNLDPWQLQNDALSLGGLCLDTANATPVAGTGIVLAACQGTATQAWFVRLGHVRLEAFFLCLSETSTAFGSGRVVVLQSCDVNVTSQEIWMQ